MKASLDSSHLPVYCLWLVAYLWLTMTAQLGWIFLIYGHLLCNVGEMGREVARS